MVGAVAATAITTATAAVVAVAACEETLRVAQLSASCWRRWQWTSSDDVFAFARASAGGRSSGCIGRLRWMWPRPGRQWPLCIPVQVLVVVLAISGGTGPPPHGRGSR